MLIVLITATLLTAYAAPRVETPCNVAERIAAQMVHDPAFSHHFMGDDGYGCSLTIDGLYEVAKTCPGMKSRQTIVEQIDLHLDLALHDSKHHRDAYEAPPPLSGFG